MLETLFSIFATLLVIQGLVSLKGGFDYLNYVMKSLAEELSIFTPKVAVFAPCKGLDEGMNDFLQSLFELDYLDYQLIFAVENLSDDAVELISKWQKKYPNIKADLVVAGRSKECGQKVFNLLKAIEKVDDSVEVYAFVDSDVSLPKEWLRSLVAPLKDKEVGATTGYRWFIATKGFATFLRAAWNGTVATALGAGRGNFAWGGSMAILRTTFETIKVKDFWKGSVSDDYSLTSAVKASGLYVKFVPSCIVPSFGQTTFSELLEFTTRQVIITRVYSNKIWKILFATNFFFNSVFLWGIFQSFYSAILNRNFLPMALTFIIYLLTVWKGYLRIKAITLILVKYKGEILRYKYGYYLLVPLVSLLYLYNLVCSATTRKITWRGINYELRSSNETLITG